MTPAEVSAAVLAAVQAAVDSGELTVTPPSEVKVERPKLREHGDYATSVALQLAKAAGQPPRMIAETVKRWLAGAPGIEGVHVAGPGFLNITIGAAAQGALAAAIVDAGASYGQTDTLRGQRVNLEFVSANPTGPVHIGGVRWAAVGDALARLLQAAGALVTREYYFNDAGAQIERFARSLVASARGLPAPEDGYAGAYVDDIAKAVLERHPDLLRDSDPTLALETFRAEGVAMMFEEIKDSLTRFGVVFDVYFNEKELHARGELAEALARLRARGHVYDRDGATWLRTTDFGDDKDRVLVKSDGEWTYFAADAAYYHDKRQRGFDKVLILLGADHHGYVARYRALVAAYGDDVESTLEILIGQLVNLLRAGQPVRMSKRAGTVITLEDLVDAVGVDAGRYALARSSTDATIDIDLDLWARKTNDNPVFYVQYAHARIVSLLRNAAELGVDRGQLVPGLLRHERESDLLLALGEFPRVVATAAELREPHRVARYLEALAGTYHRFYDACRVLPQGDEQATEHTRARLWLCAATRVVLGNGLGLLGVSAPERM